MDERILTIDEIKANIEKMNSGTMHEVDQLAMMVNTQRSIIKILKNQIEELKK